MAMVSMGLGQLSSAMTCMFSLPAMGGNFGIPYQGQMQAMQQQMFGRPTNVPQPSVSPDKRGTEERWLDRRVEEMRVKL